MKNILLTAIFPLFVITRIFAQHCPYSENSDAPKEHLVGRLQIIDSRKGHPYTLFVKDDNFNLIQKL